MYTRLSQYTNEPNIISEEKESQVTDFTGRHVLLAEDIDINWEIANEILTSLGLGITRAVNGKECVDKFNKSEIGFYDAIMMDIRMPVVNNIFV